ncbi:12674_t:CDS:1, partial [Funneliformis caledonium]
RPGAFKDMTNSFEVCQWLVIERPNILMMANQLFNVFNTLLDSSVNISNLPTAILQITKPGITQPEERSLARLWHEEIKCLFLRNRNPSDAAIESLIFKIFNYEPYSNEAEE